MSDTMTQSFWKYASTLKGYSTVDDTFEKWAKKQSYSTDELRDIWAAVQLDIDTTFNKTAAITISGEPEELQQMFGQGSHATAPKLNVPKVESPIKQPGPMPGGPKPPMGGGPIGGLPPAPQAAGPIGAPAEGAPDTSGALIDELGAED